MNVAVLTAMVTVALVHLGTTNSLPCQDRSSRSQYEEFIKRHILQDEFNRSIPKEWEKYLKKKGLWCRTPVQSFIESRDQVTIDGICSRNGRRLINAFPDNLCISSSNILVHDIKFRNGCELIVLSQQKPVIVACNNVENRCRPVHFQKYQQQMPSNIPCM